MSKKRRNTAGSEERAWNEKLIRFAGRAVPVGTGIEEYGHDQHAYCKTSLFDGSLRIFCFRNRADAAMAEGVANDQPIGSVAEA